MSLKFAFNIFIFGTAFVGSSLLAILFSPIPNPQPVLVQEHSFCHKKSNYVQNQTSLDVLDLLKNDIFNGDKRRDIFSKDDSIENSSKKYAQEKAKSVQSYVNESSSMKVSHLPKDFQFAWKTHMRAWRNYSDYLNQSAKNIQTFEDDSNNDKAFELNEEINTTWQYVLNIGENYCPDLRIEIE